MPDHDPRSAEKHDLRRRAEEKIAQLLADNGTLLPQETRQVLHELQVHQTELEIQNEELHRLQAELEASHAHCLDLFDLAPVGYFTVNKEGLILEANLTGAGLLSVARSALRGQPLTSYILPEDQDIYYLHRKKLFSLAAQEIFEMRFLRADADPFWAQVDMTMVKNDTGEFEFRIVLSDITEQKIMEEELIKTRNLESLGILAGGIAHDFNNLLQTLLASISMAKIHTPPTSLAYPFLEQAETAYETATNLTNQFLAFSTGNASARTAIDPATLVRDAVSRIMNDSPVTAIFDLSPDLPRVHGTPGQLSRALGNIALNARDAMPDGGVFLVSAANVVLDQGEIPGLAAGRYVRISLKDHGTGIAPDVLPKIFDPYFSTKPPGPQKGMGLGLTVSEAIIRQHHGKIKTDPAPGKGAAFHIYLPAIAPDGSDTQKVSAGELQGSAPAKKILIMDDEPGICRLTLTFLEALGYKADAVANGEEAVKAFVEARKAGDPYNAIILDLTIPDGMGGEETLAEMRKIDPEVKAIVSSGYAKDPALTGFADYGFQAALPKPYRLSELREALGKILT